MSITETVTTVDLKYLRNRTKDQLIDIVMLYQKANIRLESDFLELCEKMRQMKEDQNP